MARPAFALALVATLLAAGPALAAEPSKPVLLPLPDTVTSLPLALEWTPSTFTPGSLERGYEVRLEDRTADGNEDRVQVVTVPAPGDLRTVTGSVMLVDGHAYRLRVRGVETLCQPDRPTACKVESGKYGDEQRTRVLLAPQPAPPQPPPASSVPAPQPPTVAQTPPAGADPPASPAATAALPVALAPQVQLAVAPPQISRPEPLPRPRWVAPALTLPLNPGSSVRLRWRENRRATFYNVQVFAGRRKILSAWPTAASLTLRPGTMRAGVHRIVVWSASGPKVAPIFEPLPWVVQVLRTGRPTTLRA